MNTQHNSLARQSPLTESATLDLNRQYSPGFCVCDAVHEADEKLARKTFGQIDEHLVEKPPCY